MLAGVGSVRALRAVARASCRVCAPLLPITYLVIQFAPVQLGVHGSFGEHVMVHETDGCVKRQVTDVPSPVANWWGCHFDILGFPISRYGSGQDEVDLALSRPPPPR